MVGEVPRCLATQTAVHHDAQLVRDPVCILESVCSRPGRWRVGKIKDCLRVGA